MTRPNRTETVAVALRELAAALESDADGPEPAQPTLVSQRTSLAVLGIPSRQFLELLRDAPELPVTRLGKLRLVPLDRLVMHLRAQAGRQQTSAADPPQDGADEVLAEVVGSTARRKGMAA